MKCIPTSLPDVLLITPDVHRDGRGFFLETYHSQKYRDSGVPSTFVQDNLSRSVYGTIRGLHAQRQQPQGKLVRVIEGEIFDVAVDIRRGSPTFLHWVAMTLSAQNFRQCYIPPGFAHGFCVISAAAQVEYKCTTFYDPNDELHLRWDDPAIDLKWPVDEPLLSSRDRAAAFLRDDFERLPAFAPRSQ